MNRTQLEHIIRAASQISGDAEIVVVGSQAIHAQPMKLPPIAFQSDEADVYPRNNPERAEEIDAAMGELSPFHDTHGYYGHGFGPATAILRTGGSNASPAVQHEHGRRDRALRGCSRPRLVQVCGGAGERHRIQPRACPAWCHQQAEAHPARTVDAIRRNFRLSNTTTH